MSKYDLTWNEEKYNKRIKEGRGQGTGNEYKPWITVHDFPSDGFVSRSPGWKSNRVYHFMSTNELRYFYILEWSAIVTDIREQFPLELTDALSIAEKLGIKHPVDNVSSFPRILTTDFMITAKIDGKEVYLARTIKPAKEIESMRTLEKFEIERVYWLQKGIDWKLVTDNDISKTFANNVEWVHTEYRLESMENLTVSYQLDICEALKDKLVKHDCAINRITSSLDKEFNVERGTSLGLFKHLLARKIVVMDMEKKLNGGSSTREIIDVINKDIKVKAL